MNYDKGEQLTVGKLKRYLASIPDDIKIQVGIGDYNTAAHYILNNGGELLLCPDCYMEDANEANISTVISFSKGL